MFITLGLLFSFVTLLAHDLWSKDQVLAAAKGLIDIAGKGGGLCIASSLGEIGNDMPMENILHILILSRNLENIKYALFRGL